MDFAGIVCFVRLVYAVEVQRGCVEERLGELAPDLGYFQKKKVVRCCVWYEFGTDQTANNLADAAMYF